jgi:peptide/nickel transport system substrate-binding protein
LFEAKTLEEEQAAARALNRAALDDVVFAPLGHYLRHHAWRRNLGGVGQGPLPFFWGVGKAA